MAPKVEEAVYAATTPEPQVIMVPIIANSPTPSDSSSFSSLSSDSDTGIQLNPPSSSNNVYERIRIPLEQNLRELVQKVTGSEDLTTVTQVKLRVIARDVSLQHLSIHTPALKELILDGSVVSSLRDLGCGLKNLKILHVNRCGLTCLDGIFGLENLEEFYIANNFLTDASQCAFLPEIKIIDLRGNRLMNISTLSFLGLCTKLEHIYLESNEEIIKFPKYRQTVKGLLPTLKTLDGSTFTEEECSTEFSDVDEDELEEYLACSTGLSKPSTSNENTASQGCFLPPIASSSKSVISQVRPSTSNGAVQKMQTSNCRPKTAIGENGNKSELPEINGTAEMKKSLPSLLTSGAPICGNVAAALRNRYKTQEAWVEKK